MSCWEMKIIAAEAHRLIALAAEDAGLRALAQEILAATEVGDPPADSCADGVAMGELQAESR